MKVLVLEPHADDAAIGCGGTIARLVEEEHTVWSFICTKRTYGDYIKETTDAFRLLGVGYYTPLNYDVRLLVEHRQQILDDLIEMKKAFHPDIVLLPSPTDVHQDHSVVAQEGVRAFMDCSVLGYEAPRNEPQTHHTMFYEITEKQLDKKVNAINCYVSQLEGRLQMGEDFIRSLAKIRGAQIGKKYAEAFTVYRYIQ